MKVNVLCAFALVAFAFTSCSKSEEAPAVPKINFIFKFDSTQARLNNIGAPTPVAAGNAAQSPRFNTMSAHYLELTPDAFTPLGGGQVLYHAAQVTTGGSSAIDFSQA